MIQTAYEATWESLARYAAPQWYQNAKFGIFIHWGIYSVPAFDNEWYPRNMYQPGSRAFLHHRARWGDQTKFGYKDFIPMLTADKFDAAAWAALFKEAGAQYVVPVAEHHDGFAMYDCSFSPWTAVKMGPKRDVIGEIAAAVRREGLVFGVSSHRAEHWWFFNGGKTFDSDVQSGSDDSLYAPAMPGPASWLEEEWESRDWQPRPNAKFLEDWLSRTRELVDKYQPQLIYFDWWIRQTVFEPYLQRFAAHYYNRGLEWDRGTVINYKVGGFPEGTAIFDVERGQLGDIRPDVWQTDTAVAKNSWGYTEEQDYKTSLVIVQDLVDIVSKNGRLLLNIGPRADGTIPEGDQAILREIGAWLAVNGEAIYGTHPWKIYGEGPTRIAAGGFQDAERPEFSGADFRFTTKGDALYAIALAAPESGAWLIESLGANATYYPAAIQSVKLLGADAPLTWTRDANGLRVQAPTPLAGSAPYALKIE